MIKRLRQLRVKLQDLDIKISFYVGRTLGKLITWAQDVFGYYVMGYRNPEWAWQDTQHPSLKWPRFCPDPEAHKKAS
jgi:hypothetical protein